MTRKRVYLIAQAALAALTAALLAAAAIGLYAEGVAVQKETGDLFNYIYTREKVAARLAPLLPLIFASLGMTLAGRILGIRDEEADKPVRDIGLQSAAGAVPQDGGRRVLILRVVFAILAAILIAAGILNGGLEDVLTKANAICMECVGLG